MPGRPIRARDGGFRVAAQSPSALQNGRAHRLLEFAVLVEEDFVSSRVLPDRLVEFVLCSRGILDGGEIGDGLFRGDRGDLAFDLDDGVGIGGGHGSPQEQIELVEVLAIDFLGRSRECLLVLGGELVELFPDGLPVRRADEREEDQKEEGVFHGRGACGTAEARY